MRFVLRFGFVLALSFGIACSSSDKATSTTPSDAGATADGATSTDAGTTLTAACASVANAYCTKLASCGSFSLQRRYTDMNACVTRESLTCVTSNSAPDVNRTADDATQCAAAYASANCTDVLSGNAPASCQPSTHPGNRALGAACAVAAQCQSGFCTTPRGEACGVCTAAGPVIGALCPQSCGIGQYCNRQTNQCTAFGQIGDACDGNLTCQPGLGCTGSTTTDAGVTQGQCQEPATIANAPCDTSTADGTPCASENGLVCSKKLCVQAPTAATGDTCGATSPTSTICTGGAECNNPIGETGTCIGPVADGAPCDTSTVANCLTGSACIGTSTGGRVVGTCQVRASATCN